MTIYIIHCSANGKYYVGQTVEKSLRAYLRKKRSHAQSCVEKCNHIYSALRKYPFDSFSIEILTTCSTKAELDNFERLWIIALDSRNDFIGMNICPGGEGGWLGLKHRPESIEKMRAHPNFARGFHTEEARKAHSERMKGAGNPLYGKTRIITPEWAAKIGVSNTGKKSTPESRQKQSIARKAWWAKQADISEHRQNMSRAQKLRFAKERECQPH